MKWTVDFYSKRVMDGVHDWPPTILTKFLRIVDLIEKLGPEKVGMPHVKPMKKGLSEIRAKGSEGIGRALFCTKKGRLVIVLNEFIKKTEKTPPKELNIALKRMEEVKRNE